MNDTEKCLDSHLWHACAGGTVQMPLVNTKVYYFPQGQAEHSQFPVQFGCSPRTPALFLCRVLSVKFMADPETDEVFSKIRLAPVPHNSPDSGEDDELALGGNPLDGQGNPTSFAKTLTQSDANNGGGFSVPRYCAETIFLRLDYLVDPPVQTILAKDVHGEAWKFRHIYRGTPRRHLFTTGWSSFVSRKKLAAGDSIIFLRAEDGDLRVGIRRAKRGIIGFSVLAREEEGKMTRGGNGGTNSVGNSRGRVRPDSVIEAAALAAEGRTFEVVYYPWTSAPDFCVKASAVRAALRVEWFAGMRFKMAFETEDSSRISWFMGTLSSVQVADPMRWPNSPWRLLQVTWDEPDLLQNVKCVSPWLVELVSEMTSIHLAPFSAPRKKPRIEPHPDITLSGQIPIPPFTGYPFGIQGARHAQFGVSLPDLHLNNLQFHPTPAPRITTGLVIRDPSLHDKVSCVLTIGNSNSSQSMKNSKTSQLVLFGQPILTEEQISLSSSKENSSSVENPRKIPDASGFPWFGSRRGSESETGHCKVFMESEDAGLSLDLATLRSYGAPFSEFLRSARG